MKRPRQSNALYDALLASRTEDAALIAISNGILALCSNARRLLQEAKFLCEHGYFATAHFLLVTTDEEIAKVYILLDIVRLDFAKHEGELRKLCNAFYSHIVKSAYMKVTRFTGFVNMEDAKDLFEAYKIEFLPGDYESGEPDMLSLALSAREWNLYVDYSDYDRDWWTPSDRHAKSIIVNGFPETLAEEVERSLLKLEKTRDSGLFSSDCLQILRKEFSKKFITVRSSNDKIKDAYRRVLLEIERMGLTLPEESDNALLQWPLYSLL